MIISTRKHDAHISTKLPQTFLTTKDSRITQKFEERGEVPGRNAGERLGKPGDDILRSMGYTGVVQCVLTEHRVFALRHKAIVVRNHERHEESSTCRQSDCFCTHNRYWAEWNSDTNPVHDL